MQEGAGAEVTWVPSPEQRNTNPKICLQLGKEGDLLAALMPLLQKTSQGNLDIHSEGIQREDEAQWTVAEN